MFKNLVATLKSLMFLPEPVREIHESNLKRHARELEENRVTQRKTEPYRSPTPRTPPVSRTPISSSPRPSSPAPRMDRYVHSHSTREETVTVQDNGINNMLMTAVILDSMRQPDVVYVQPVYSAPEPVYSAPDPEPTRYSDPSPSYSCDSSPSYSSSDSSSYSCDTSSSSSSWD
jgi:hypothetical protein